MKKTSIFLIVVFLISCIPFTVRADDFTSDISEPPMYATNTALKWSDAYQCVIPDVDGSYPYIAIVQSSYGSYGKVGVYFSSVPIKRDTGVSTNAAYKSLVIDGSFYFKSFGNATAENVEKAYNWLFTSSSSTTGLTIQSSVSGDYKSEKSVDFLWNNHTIQSTNQSTGEVTTIPVKWIVSLHVSDTDAFKNLFATLWEKMGDVSISVFGVELSAIAVLVGPFIVAMSIGFLHSIFGFAVNISSMAVRVSQNQISRKQLRGEKYKKKGDD